MDAMKMLAAIARGRKMVADAQISDEAKARLNAKLDADLRELEASLKASAEAVKEASKKP